MLCSPYRFDKESNTLYTQWSAIPVDGALAWLRPLVQVPGHKFNVNKGRSVLTKDCTVRRWLHVCLRWFLHEMELENPRHRVVQKTKSMFSASVGEGL